MLYLAKLQNLDVTSDKSSVLLICQKADDKWSLVPSDMTVSLEETLSTFLQTGNEQLSEDLQPDGFVLVDISQTGQIKSIEDATSWFLVLIGQYVSQKLTPEFLLSEAKRAEEWRQFLTLQNQEVVRRSLEVETRREQIQELEKGLEDRRTKLENMQESLAADQAALQKSQQDLDAKMEALSQQQQEWNQKKTLLLAELAELEQRRQQLAEG